MNFKVGEKCGSEILDGFQEQRNVRTNITKSQNDSFLNLLRKTLGILCVL